MNKALHVFVYLFLALAGASLWFEIQLNAKRSLLTQRNRMQEDYYVKIAHTIEKDGAPKLDKLELKKDVSPVEDKLVDTPDTENVLDDYNNVLETMNLDTYNWEGARAQLRMVYLLDGEGKIVMDGAEPVMKGKGTEDELLSALFESAKNQQSRLNSTRSELIKMREKLIEQVEEINKLKPEARQDKLTITEKKAEIAKLEGEKTELQGEITRQKSQIEDLNTQITALNDDLTTAKNETEEVREELEKNKKTVEQLKKLMKEMLANEGTKVASSAIAVTSLSAGDKGQIAEADNENMFAIVKFSDEAMNELKGNNPNARLAQIELGVKRPGFKGAAGEFVGRIRIRQEIKGQPYVICDILGTWEQDKLQKDDIIFAD